MKKNISAILTAANDAVKQFGTQTASNVATLDLETRQYDVVAGNDQSVVTTFNSDQAVAGTEEKGMFDMEAIHAATAIAYANGGAQALKPDDGVPMGQGSVGNINLFSPGTIVDAESLTNVDPSVSAAYTLTANTLNIGVKSDAVIDGFFRALPIDAREVNINLEVANLYTQKAMVINKVNGGFDKHEGRKPVISNINSFFDENHGNRLYPNASAEDASDKLVVAAKTTISYNGDDDYETAPVAFNKETNILSISQSSASLANKVLNENNTIEANVSIEEIWFAVKDGTTGDADMTKLIKFDTSIMPNNSFHGTYNGDVQDIQLSFEGTLVISTATKNALGNTTLTALADLGQNNAVIKFDMAGKGNINTGRLRANLNDFSLSELLDGDNSEITSGTDYDKAVDVIGNLVPVGYTVKAFQSLAGKNIGGLKVTSETVKFNYGVSFGEALEVSNNKPVQNNAIGLDTELITSLSGLSSYSNRTKGYRVLKDFTRYLAAITKDGVISPSTKSISQEVVKTAYHTGTIDLDSINTMTVKDRTDEVKEKIIGELTTAVETLNKKSGFKRAVEIMNGPNAQPTVTIGMHDDVFNLLKGEKPVIAGWTVVVNASESDELREATGYGIYIMFTDSVNVTDKPTRLTSGISPTAPYVTIAGTVTLNNTQVERVVGISRKEFYPLVNIIGKLSITGKENMFNKKS